MARDVAETLHLYWVAGHDGHYLNNLCRSWADALDNFQYTPVVAEDAGKSVPALGQIAKDHSDLSLFDIYAAGPGEFLAAVKKFLHDKKFPENQIVVSRVD